MLWRWSWKRKTGHTCQALSTTSWYIRDKGWKQPGYPPDCWLISVYPAPAHLYQAWGEICCKAALEYGNLMLPLIPVKIRTDWRQSVKATSPCKIGFTPLTHLFELGKVFYVVVNWKQVEEPCTTFCWCENISRNIPTWTDIGSVTAIQLLGPGLDPELGIEFKGRQLLYHILKTS